MASCLAIISVLTNLDSATPVRCRRRLATTRLHSRLLRRKECLSSTVLFSSRMWRAEKVHGWSSHPPNRMQKIRRRNWFNQRRRRKSWYHKRRKKTDKESSRPSLKRNPITNLYFLASLVRKLSHRSWTACLTKSSSSHRKLRSQRARSRAYLVDWRKQRVKTRRTRMLWAVRRIRLLKLCPTLRNRMITRARFSKHRLHWKELYLR